MTRPQPLTVAQWREYLRGYSAEVLASDQLRDAVDEGRAGWLTEDQRAAGWLGFEPATEQEVLAAEERLGVQLPPTYRNFLLTSNGWNWIGALGGYPVDLLRADRIGWFAELDRDLLEAWATLDHFTMELRRLERCLLISDDDGGVGCRWLLHVDDGGQDGELTAYEWFPGDGEAPYPNDNFAALATRTLSTPPRGGQGDVGRRPTRHEVRPRGRMRIDRLDHLALTVADQDATIDFYTRVLGMEAVTADGERTALAFGDSRIELRADGQDPERAAAARPRPGSAELCFVVDTPVLLLADELADLGVNIEAGPVRRNGARGTIYSLSVRDPDGNLIKLSNYLD